jgi:hypothetical protein
VVRTTSSSKATQIPWLLEADSKFFHLIFYISNSILPRSSRNF